MAGEGVGTVLARAGLGGGAAGRTGGTEVEPGRATSPASRPLSEPIFLTSVYRFADMTRVEEVWEGLRKGFVYRRLGHPNQAALEEVLARLEGAEEALACSSGMGALFSAVIAHLRSGDHIVAQAGLYGGTQTLLTDELSRLGITCSFVSAATGEAFEEALRALEAEGRRPRAMLVETLANPSLAVAELPDLSALAARRGLLLIVDNTFATPLGCRPLRWGPALVVHSATKFLNGHSDVTAGVVAGPKELVGPLRRLATAVGLTIAPFDAWLLLRGLRTLHLRFERQQRSALEVASWLEGRRGVKRVLYPGLPSHPSHGLALRVLDGFGAVLSFELEGGEEAVRAFVARLKLIPLAPSLGETATTVTYPARTSHRSLSLEEREAAGAYPGLVRLSVGTEDTDDILEDLDQALG